MSNVEQGISNYEVLSMFFLAVPLLLTKIEINWLLSSNNSSSFIAGYYFKKHIINKATKGATNVRRDSL